MLAVLTAALLIFFGGVTDRLIPLYAIGAFLAFTLSQAGMVRHWMRAGGAWHNIFVNGLGAVATGATTLVVLTAKFTDGAWVTVLLIPVMLFVMTWVRRHYRAVASEVASQDPADFRNIESPIVVVPVAGWNKITQKALCFAYAMSHEVRAVHISAGDQTEDEFCRDWVHFADAPARQAGLPPPELVVIDSPYRYVLTPILNYVLELEETESRPPDRRAAAGNDGASLVSLPAAQQRAEILKAWILVKGNQRIAVVSVPWYLQA